MKEGSKERKNLTMYSPKELEGEVDHSFFDSDCDGTGTKPEITEPEKLSNHTESRSEKDESQADTLEKEMSGLELQSGLRVKVESDFEEDPPERKDDAKKDEAACEGEDSDTSSRKSSSPLPRSDMSESSRGSQSDDLSSICSSSSSSEEDDAVFKNEEDAYHCNEPAKKASGKFRNWSHSYSSSSSSGERSPTPQVKLSSSPSTSSPRQQPRPGSANRKQRPRTSETASDDTVTDVTPLSSPDASPQQSFDLAPPTSTESTPPVPPTESVDGQQLDMNTDGEEQSGRYHGRKRV